MEGLMIDPMGDGASGEAGRAGQQLRPAAVAADGGRRQRRQRRRRRPAAGGPAGRRLHLVQLRHAVHHAAPRLHRRQRLHLRGARRHRLQSAVTASPFCEPKPRLFSMKKKTNKQKRPVESLSNGRRFVQREMEFTNYQVFTTRAQSRNVPSLAFALSVSPIKKSRETKNYYCESTLNAIYFYFLPQKNLVSSVSIRNT